MFLVSSTVLFGGILDNIKLHNEIVSFSDFQRAVGMHDGFDVAVMESAGCLNLETFVSFS